MIALAPNLNAITPWSPLESIGSKLVGAGQLLASAASTTNPTANMAVYVPFVLTRQIVVAQLFWFNGATANGNVDCGIYSGDGARIASTGSTAQSGTSVVQTVDVTDFAIGPGLFYMALASDSGTATFIASATGLLAITSAAGVLAQGTAFVLPATATFATATADYVPVFGLSTRSVL